MNKTKKRLPIWQTSKVVIIGMIIMLLFLNAFFALGTMYFGKSPNSFYFNIVLIPIYLWLVYKHNLQITNFHAHSNGK